MKKMGALDWCMLAVIISCMMLILFLSGCGTATTRSTSGDLDHQERLTGSGTVGAQPFTFDVTRNVTESSKESQESKTILQAPELASAISLALRTSFPALGAVLPSPGLSSTEIGALITAAITTAGFGIKAVQSGRANARADVECKRAEEHKADAAEGWAKATSGNA